MQRRTFFHLGLGALAAGVTGELMDIAPRKWANDNRAISQSLMNAEYFRLYDYIEEQLKNANAQGKKLILLLGEGHNASNCMLMQLMASDIAARLGITDLTIEQDNKGIDNYSSWKQSICILVHDGLTFPERRKYLETETYDLKYSKQLIKDSNITSRDRKWAQRIIDRERQLHNVLSKTEDRPYLNLALLYLMNDPDLKDRRDNLTNAQNLAENKDVLMSYYLEVQILFARVAGIRIKEGDPKNHLATPQRVDADINFYDDYMEREKAASEAIATSSKSHRLAEVGAGHVIGHIDDLSQDATNHVIGLDMMNMGRYGYSKFADIRLQQVMVEREKRMESCWHTNLPMLPQLKISEGYAMMVLASARHKLFKGELTNNEYEKFVNKVSEVMPQITAGLAR